MNWFKKQKLWLKILIVVLLIGAIGSAINGGKGKNSISDSNNNSNKIEPHDLSKLVFEGDFETFIEKLNKNEINEGDLVKVTGYTRYGFNRFWNKKYDVAKNYAKKNGYSDWIEFKEVRYPHYEYYGRFYLPYEMFDSLWNNQSKFSIPDQSNVTLIGKVKLFKVDIKTKPTYYRAEVVNCEIKL